MFSKILIKLIDEAIVPAITLLSVRILSVVAIGKYLGVPFTFGSQGFVFQSAEDFVVVNSYSLVSMVLVVAFGIIYILVKAYLFHDSHVKPGATAKLFSLKLTSFIQSSFDLYSQGAIWMSYSYLLMFVAGIMGVFGLVYMWVFFVSVILSIIATILFIIDVEKELYPEESDLSKNDTDEDYVLHFGAIE